MNFNDEIALLYYLADHAMARDQVTIARSCLRIAARLRIDLWLIEQHRS